MKRNKPIKVNLIVPEPENLSKLIARAKVNFYISTIKEELPEELWGEACEILLEKARKELDINVQAG